MIINDGSVTDDLLLLIILAAANCLSSSFFIFSRTNKREVKVFLPRGIKPYEINHSLSSINKIYEIFTLVGSLKSGKSRRSTADKPSAIQTIVPTNKKHQEYFTINVEYLNKKKISNKKLSFIFTNPRMIFSIKISARIDSASSQLGLDI